MLRPSKRSIPLRSIVSIRFISGREEKYEVDFWGGTGAKARFKEFLSNPTIVLQLSGEVLVIPASAIESISFATTKDATDKMDLGTFRAAKRVK